MSILDLSCELILLIADHLSEAHDVFALLQTHRGIAQFLIHTLSKFARLPKYSTAALLCYAAHGDPVKVHSHLTLLRDPWAVAPITAQDVTAAIAAGANFALTTPSPGGEHALRALHWAVINDRPALIRFLLAKGADLEFRDPKTGGKAIDHAIAQGNSALVRLLVASGADVTAWEPKCGSLLHCLIACTWKERIALRAAAAAEPQYRAILRTLLDGGADIDARDRHGHTALHVAVLCWGAAVDELLRAGADVNARDGNGNTPLHLAALNPGSSAMVKVLLANGADPMLRNADRRAPICLQPPEASDEAVQLLVDARGAHRCGKKCKAKRRKMSAYDLRLSEFWWSRTCILLGERARAVNARVE